MKKFSLYRTGAGAANGKWVFEPFKGGMSVFDADDREVCWFPHSEANERFTLPSFWRSIKYIGFLTTEGATVEFESDSRSVAKVKEYLEDAIACQGIEAVQRLGSRGWVTLLGGVGLIFLGVLIFSLIYEVLEVRSRVVGYVAVGMAITGIGNIAWGASALSRARRIRNRLQESEV